MNLVTSIMDLLSSDVLSKLSGLLGIDEQKIESAVGAAVPSLLSGLTSLASQEEGMQKITRALGGFGDGTFSNLERALKDDPNLIQQKGTGMLNSLFGEGLVSSLASAIGRFAGLNTGAITKLLGYLMPLVLGRVASQWNSQGGTPGALKELLGHQQRNIAAALPSGFSLDNVPGLASFGDVSRAATRAATGTHATASRSMMSTLLPLGLLLLGGLLLWNFWRSRPSEPVAVEGERMATGREGAEGDSLTTMKPITPDVDALPDVTRMRDDLAGIFGSIGETMTSITDANSAEAALPKLEELNQKIDTMKAAYGELPRTGRASLQSFLQDQLDPLKRQATETASLPGLSDRIRSLINAIISKLEELRIVE